MADEVKVIRLPAGTARGAFSAEEWAHSRKRSSYDAMRESLTRKKRNQEASDRNLAKIARGFSRTK